jgi:hypothetical protein
MAARGSKKRNERTAQRNLLFMRWSPINRAKGAAHAARQYDQASRWASRRGRPEGWSDAQESIILHTLSE